MLNKNDPLIAAVQKVMQSNQAERDAVNSVNEKFGIADRRALPHELQGQWDAAYKTVLTEGVEALDEAKLSPEHKKVITQKLQNIHGKGKVKFGPNGATWSDGTEERTHDVTVNKSGKVKMDSSPYVESQLEEEALDEKSFAALAPPYDEPTQKDRLVGAGVLKKHPTQPGKHVLAKEDMTSPSEMGIKGPDYAPAGTIPDYAVRKTVGPKSDLIKKPSTSGAGNSKVTPTGKTSSSATKSSMEEEKKMKGDDPCWDNYEMIGMKKGKGGKPVPNCVPVKEEKEMSSDDEKKARMKAIIKKRFGSPGKESVSQSRRQDLEEKAPPGREDQVKALKKKFPKGSSSPFEIAWTSYNKSKVNENWLRSSAIGRALEYGDSGNPDKSGGGRIAPKSTGSVKKQSMTGTGVREPDDKVGSTSGSGGLMRPFQQTRQDNFADTMNRKVRVDTAKKAGGAITGREDLQAARPETGNLKSYAPDPGTLGDKLKRAAGGSNPASKTGPSFEKSGRGGNPSLAPKAAPPIPKAKPKSSAPQKQAPTAPKKLTNFQKTNLRSSEKNDTMDQTRRLKKRYGVSEETKANRVRTNLAAKINAGRES